jgi:hypothetical protein
MSDWTSIASSVVLSGFAVDITGGAQTDSATTPAASTASAATAPIAYPGLVRSGSWKSSAPSAMLAIGSTMSMVAWELASGPTAYAACRSTMPSTPVAIMA